MTSSGLEPVWYAVYTRPRYEKKVSELFDRSGIAHYLPLVKTIRQWSDRKKMVEEPLFKSYIFVHITEQEHLQVLQTHGVVRFVTFERKKVRVREIQIQAIREYLGSDIALMPENLNDYIPGKRVKVNKGTLKGLEGRLVEVLGKQRVRIEIEAVNQSVFLKIPKSSLEIIGDAEKDAEARYW